MYKKGDRIGAILLLHVLLGQWQKHDVAYIGRFSRRKNSIGMLLGL